MAHWECKYCDRPAGYMGIPIKVDDELICACGAEWADAKILVEDEEHDDSDFLNDRYRATEVEEDDSEFFDYELDAFNNEEE